LPRLPGSPKKPLVRTVSANQFRCSMWWRWCFLSRITSANDAISPGIRASRP
jgi:hypothetical protein